MQLYITLQNKTTKPPIAEIHERDGMKQKNPKQTNSQQPRNKGEKVEEGKQESPKIFIIIIIIITIPRLLTK